MILREEFWRESKKRINIFIYKLQKSYSIYKNKQEQNIKPKY